MVFDLYTLVEAFWLILPAYAANGLTPFIGLKKKLHPIDGGRRFYDGRPVLGNGKTWEGLFFACTISVLISIVQVVAYPYLPFYLSPVPLDIIPMNPLLGFFLGLGAMVGDITGSFIKRRLNIPRGGHAPILDQLDFLLGSLFFVSFFVRLKQSWIILLVVMTPLLHYSANFIGYKLGVKKQPW